jgi:hypothetical protein
MSLTTSLKKAVMLAVVGATAWLAATPASAIIVNGKFDPRYGLPFVGTDPDPNVTSDDMWWSGEATFFIPDTPACAPDANMIVTCSGMYVTNAVVYLTQGQNGTPLDTLSFTGSSVITSAKLVAGGGNIEWANSNWFEPLVAGTSLTFSLNNYLFSLGFDEQGALLFHTEKSAFLDRHGSHGDQEDVFWNGVGKGHLGELCGPDSGAGDGLLCGFSDDHADVIFTPVPEPSTYALMFAGLAAVGFMARRRRPQA